MLLAAWLGGSIDHRSGHTTPYCYIGTVSQEDAGHEVDPPEEGVGNPEDVRPVHPKKFDAYIEGRKHLVLDG